MFVRVWMEVLAIDDKYLSVVVRGRTLIGESNLARGNMVKPQFPWVVGQIMVFFVEMGQLLV